MASYADMIEEAQNLLTGCSDELNEDSRYYEASHVPPALGTSIPPQMRKLKSAVGYGRLYLDSLNERIEITGFRYPGSTEADEELQRWWQINDLDEESGIAHLETLIHGRCYVTVSAPTAQDVLLGHPADVPLITVESPRHMFAKIDPRTRHVEYAVRFYLDPTRLGYSYKEPEQSFTLYLPNRTVFLTVDAHGKIVEDRDPIIHNLGVVPVIPFYNRERLSDRFGRSEIVPEIRSAQDNATRIVMNMQAAAELMAAPQRILFGVQPNELPVDPNDPYAKYKMFMANILTFGNEQGSATQFTAAELSNYTTALQEIAKQVASYTGLPPQYLSFSSENPASADAIRASENRLVKKCELKGRMFGNCWEKVMRLGMAIMRDGLQNVPEEAFRMQAILADPSTPTWAAKADAAQKLVAGKAVIPVERARIDLGYTPEEREEMRRMDQDENDELAAAMLGRPSAKFPLPTTGSQSNQDSGSSTDSA